MLQPFGKVTVASVGTPVRATSITSKAVLVRSLLVQALAGNTGVVYVLYEENRANSPGAALPNLTKCIGIIGAPAAGASPPSFSFTAPGNAAGGVDLTKVWFDVVNAGEGVIVVAEHDKQDPIS